MRLSIFLLFCFSSLCLQAQRIDFESDPDKNLFIKLYGEVHFNQPINKNVREFGVFDVHRLVTLFGYQFNKNTQFVSEIEFEHGDEVFVEQAFIKHKLVSNISLRAGMILVPMSIVNVNHEPTAFNGVERPLVDKHIIPSTWRSIGIGFSGLLPDQSIKYQAYLLEGMKSYDDGALLSSSSPVRQSRQKGLTSVNTGLPSVAAELEYFGISGLKMSASYFGGQTESSLNNGLDLNNEQLVLQADSSMVRLRMVTLQGEYNVENFTLRAQGTYGSILDTENYNLFTGSDVGSAFYGFYIEPAFHIMKDDQKKWTFFSRFSMYDTEFSVAEDVANHDTQNTVLTSGFGYYFTKGVVGKMDFQQIWNDSNMTQTFNAGIGVWF